jgi:hypothetical protein
VNAVQSFIAQVGEGGGGGSSTAYGSVGFTVDRWTVLSILISFLVGALIALAIYRLGKRAGYLDSSESKVEPVPQAEMLKYQAPSPLDDLPF